MELLLEGGAAPGESQSQGVMASRGEALLGREPSVNLDTEPGEKREEGPGQIQCVARSCSLWAPASSFVN